VRLALIRKAGAVIRAHAHARCWLQSRVPGHSLYSPLISELYYSITWRPSRLPRPTSGRIEKYTSMNQPTLPRSELQTDFICCPLIYSARERTYIRHNRNRLSAGRYYVTARFRIQSRMESLGPKLQHDSRCSRRRENGRAREKERERERMRKTEKEKNFLCKTILSSESVTGKEDEVSRRTWKKSRRSNRARAPVLRKVTRLELGTTLRKAFPACRWHLHRTWCANYIGFGAFPFARSNIVRCNFSFLPLHDTWGMDSCIATESNEIKT